MSDLSPERFGRITASNAGALLGVSPFKSARKALSELVDAYFGVQPELTPYQIEILRYGREMEPIAASAYEWVYKNKLQLSQFYKYEDWLGATPDRETEENGRRKLVEIKCPYKFRAGLASGGFASIFSDELAYYYAQIQIQMLCSRVEQCRCDFFQFSGKYEYKREIVDFDPTWIDNNIPKLKAIHNEYRYQVKLLQEPAKMQDLETLLQQYDYFASVVTNAEALKKEALAKIVEICGNSEVSINGRQLSKVVRTGNVNYKDIYTEYLADKDINLDNFRGKSSEYWTIK